MRQHCRRHDIDVDLRVGLEPSSRFREHEHQRAQVLVPQRLVDSVRGSRDCGLEFLVRLAQVVQERRYSQIQEEAVLWDSEETGERARPTVLAAEKTDGRLLGVARVRLQSNGRAPAGLGFCKQPFHVSLGVA
jgi:hypothetical protein